MRGGVDLLELLDREMRVELRRLELGVIEQGLDHPRVGSVLEHVRRAGVPEEVATARLADVGRVHVVADHLGQAVWSEGFPEVGQKKSVVAPGRAEARPSLLEVLVRPGERPLADGNHAVPFPLAQADEDETPLGVEIAMRPAPRSRQWMRGRTGIGRSRRRARRKIEGRVPGRKGREADAVTDGTAGGLGAAALTGGALVLYVSRIGGARCYAVSSDRSMERD